MSELKKKNNSNQKEEETHDLIQSLGDISVKSLISNEVSICKNGIDKLSEIALNFLELKKKNEEKYKVVETKFFSESSKNQYITYILNEFDRVFYNAIKQKNSDVTRHVVFKLAKISSKALNNKNNWYIFEKLFETRNYFGSIYWRFTDYAIREGPQLDRDILIQHLVSIPQHAIIFNDYNLAFIEHFIIHHIYRINKLIIDNDDFTTFKNEIDFFSKTLQFKDPKLIARDIDASLYPHNFGLLDEDVSKYCDKLQFIINYKSMKDFNQVFEFQKELENYTNLILSKIQDDNQKELEKEKLIGLNKNIVEFYISSLLYGVFFKIACYIISKGENYLHYLKELWYHTDPQEKSFHNILNTTPISEDVDWNILYSIYGGKGSRIYDDIDFFDDFQDYQIYFHQYAILNILKHARIIRIPSIDEISTIDNKGRTFLLDYFYELVYGFKEDDFLNALETIKNTKFTSLIRLKEDETIEKRISDVRNLLEEAKKNKETVIDKIVSMKPVIKEKLDTYLNQIKKEYFERSVVDYISQVTYDPAISESEFKILQGNYSMKREYFVEQTISSNMVYFGPGSNISFPEIKYVFEIIKNCEIKIISENTKDFLTQIEKNVKHLKDLGYNPNSMFIPINVEHKLRLKNWQIFTTTGLKIDNQEIRTINSWNKFPFDEIIIFDSKCLNIKYQSDKKDNRLSFEIGDTKKGLKIIEIIASLKLIANIKDTKGFIKINNDEAKKDVK